MAALNERNIHSKEFMKRWNWSFWSISNHAYQYNQWQNHTHSQFQILNPSSDQSHLIGDAEKAARRLSTHFLNHHCHHHRCHHTFQWFHYHFGGSTTIAVVWQILAIADEGGSGVFKPSKLAASVQYHCHHHLSAVDISAVVSPVSRVLLLLPENARGGGGGDQFNQSTGWLISSVKQKISSVKGSLSSFYRRCKSLGT